MVGADTNETYFDRYTRRVYSMFNSIFTFKDYPSHTQAVERSIRLISQTATMFSDPDDRDARIRNYLAAKKIMPKTFNSKKNFTHVS